MFTRPLLIALMLLPAPVAAADFSGLFFGGGVTHQRATTSLEIDRQDTLVEPDILSLIPTEIDADLSGLSIDTSLNVGDIDPAAYSPQGFGVLQDTVDAVAASVAGVLLPLYRDEAERILQERVDNAITLGEQAAEALARQALSDLRQDVAAALAPIQSFVLDQQSTRQEQTLTATSPTLSLLAQFPLGPMMVGLDTLYNFRDAEARFDCSIVASADHCAISRGHSITALLRVGVPWGNWMPYVTGGIDFALDQDAGIYRGATKLLDIPVDKISPTFGAGMQASFGRLSFDAQYRMELPTTVQLETSATVGTYLDGDIVTAYRGTAEIDVTHTVTARAMIKLW